MKVLKKFAGMILAVCLMVPMAGTVVFAAEGVLMFSDPSAKVGDNVDVDLVVKSNSGETVGDVEVTMTYDPKELEFVSGDGFTADGSGTLTYSGTGDSAELRETMTFRALTAGDAQITVDSSTASLASDESLELKEGSSKVTIAAADDGTTSVEPSGTTAAGETTDIVVTVNGTDYNFSEAFTSNDIPDGYSETTLTFNGEERKFVANEAGVTLGYLVDASGAGSFFMFNTEDATFSPYIELKISDTTSIVPLSDADSVSLPDNYQQVDLTVQEQQYPAWSDPMAPRYYVIYALNTRTGDSALYQYDTEDGTYQAFTAPADNTDESSGAALPGSIGKLISDHILLFLIALAVVILVMLVLIIVFAVKLVHRNQELDDLYDEYDIPYDDEEDEDKKADTVKPDKKKKKKAVEEPADDEYEDDDYDDEYEDDDYEDDGDYEDDDYDDYDDDSYDDDSYDEDDDYEDEDDDEAEEVTSPIRRSGKKKKSSSSDDDYDINFIDL